MHTRTIPSAPRNLSDDERALWCEGETDCTPRRALVRLSVERFTVEQARERIALLERMLRDARDWLDHDTGHGEECSACRVEEEIDEALGRRWL